MAETPVDPVALTVDLVRCPSVTPEEGGALQLLEQRLSAAGFVCTRADRNGIANRSEERRVGEECRSRWAPYH